MALNHPLPPTRGKLSQNGFFGQVGSGGRCGGGSGVIYGTGRSRTKVVKQSILRYRNEREIRINKRKYKLNW
jgi:hypothetical protein